MGYAMAAEAPGGAEVIRRIEIGEITPAAGEVVIEHEAIGVNFIDIYIRTGAYPWPVDKDLILGSEGAGRSPPSARASPIWRSATVSATRCRTGPMPRSARSTPAWWSGFPTPLPRTWPRRSC